jgi:hypothetical protein
VVTSTQAVAFDARENDGIHVLPLGHSRQDAVTVSVDDERGGHRFDLAVARDRAPVAFYHPFAYAAANSDGVL